VVLAIVEPATAFLTSFLLLIPVALNHVYSLLQGQRKCDCAVVPCGGLQDAGGRICRVHNEML